MYAPWRLAVEMPEGEHRVSFGDRWRAAHPACGCGRPGCAGCSLTPRTVFVLQAELAWLVDVGLDELADIETGHRPAEATVFARLPQSAVEWAGSTPRWLERFCFAARDYVGRLGKPGPVDPRTLAEEVAVWMALAAARSEPDPDNLLPPDVAEALPALPGDYAWPRAEAALALSADVRSLYSGDSGLPLRRSDRRHPECWFDPR